MQERRPLRGDAQPRVGIVAPASATAANVAYRTYPHRKTGGHSGIRGTMTPFLTDLVFLRSVVLPINNNMKSVLSLLVKVPKESW